MKQETEDLDIEEEALEEPLVDEPLTIGISARRGSRVSPKNAKRIDAAFKLIRARDGKCTHTDLLEYARAKESPIHDLFDWDDSVAGERWREHQARQYLYVVVMVESDTKAQMPAYVPITTEQGRTPTPMPEVLNKKEWVDEVVMRWFKQARALVERNRHLRVLMADPSVFDAIDKLLPVAEQAQKKKPKKGKDAA